jgi:hypothetical protein
MPAAGGQPAGSWPWSRRIFVPLTGAWILGLDWLIFSKNLFTAGLAWPVAIALGFVLGGVGTLFLQRSIGHDRWPTALSKALLAGLIVGFPFPVLGTVVGGWVLLASGWGRGRRPLP